MRFFLNDLKSLKAFKFFNSHLWKNLAVFQCVDERIVLQNLVMIFFYLISLKPFGGQIYLQENDILIFQK